VYYIFILNVKEQQEVRWSGNVFNDLKPTRRDRNSVYCV